MLAQKLINNLLAEAHIRPKQKEVIMGRFGLDSDGKKTLAAIGEKLNLTRERVRQIEESALKEIRVAVRSDPQTSSAIGAVAKHLKKIGGASSADYLLGFSTRLLPGLSHEQLQFLAEASSAFHFYPEDENFSGFYYLTDHDRKATLSFLESWAEFLNKNKNAVLSGGYNDCLKKFAKSSGVKLDVAESILAISRRICKNPYGEIGLSSWPEISPATAKDRAYFILKKFGKPLHFEEIAKEINNAGFGSRVALAATVHNELIKDDRFVLVGRGIYGLREHGYEPGFARDVIKNVLKRHGPLRQKDVIDHVNKQRFFKPNTIIVNLQNRDYFERLTDGRYRVSEA